MLTLTNGRSLRDGLETMEREGFSVSREGLQSLGREGLQAGREGLHAIGSSMADLAETLPLRPKRRRSFPLLGAIAVAIASAVAVALIAGFLSRRNGLGSLKPGSKTQRRFDADAASRAADEGMGTAIGASAADDLLGRSDEPELRPEYKGLSRVAGA
jgi:hypothetical protein